MGSQVAHLVRAPNDELLICHNAHKAPIAIARSGESYPPADQHMLHNISPCKGVLYNKCNMARFCQSVQKHARSISACWTMTRVARPLEPCAVTCQPISYLLRDACNCSQNLARRHQTKSTWQESSFPRATRPQNLTQHECWKQQHKDWFYSTWVLEAKPWRGC